MLRSNSVKSESFVSVVLVQSLPLAALESIVGSIQRELDLNYSDFEVVVIGQGAATAFTPQDEAVFFAPSSKGPHPEERASARVSKDAG